MQVTDEMKRAALATVGEGEVYDAVWAQLREYAVKELLAAKTDVDRREAWHRAKAIEDAPRKVKAWAAQARIEAEKG